LTRRLQKVRLDDAGRPDDLGCVVAMAQLLAERLQHSLHRLGHLVDDLLDDSCIQEGRLDLRLAPADLCAIVRTVVEEQRALAGTRPIHLELPGAQPCLVTVDACRIEQVVTNYLTNALKYSQNAQPVVVRLQVDGEMVRVSVRDEGIGVVAAEQTAIWGRFHRAAGSTIQSGSDIGIGIGLHICKTIIEAHGGQVGLASEVGKGSTFWFALPLSRRG
jgi:signal transduction histidine kinase